jgi:exodeoxyribonuclease VII small subunit
MKKTDKKEISFTEAFEELTRIASEMENNELPLEVLSENVKRAIMLATLCKNKLREVEEQMNKVLEGDGSVPEN